MKITSDEVLHVANLARLQFAPDEVDGLAAQLSGILDYVEKLGELDLADVEPMAHVHEIFNAFRADEPRSGLSNEAAVSNAPDSETGCFRVPKVIE